MIEVGAGQGANFSYYPTSVEYVVAVEPEDYLRQRAEQAVVSTPVPVTVLDGVADELPGGDGSFDAGVAALVLCTVPDQDRALADLFRVIKPGGELRFYEHVRAPEPGLARAQRALDVVWTPLSGGCHLSRDTRAAIERSGFEIESCEAFDFQPTLMHLPGRPHILGVARRT